MQDIRVTRDMAQDLSDEMKGVLSAYEDLFCAIMTVVSDLAVPDHITHINLNLPTRHTQGHSKAFRLGFDGAVERISSRLTAASKTKEKPVAFHFYRVPPK